MATEVVLALILGASVGAVAGYLGSLMISKRMALVGGAFGHLALPGVSLALAYGFDVTIGAALVLSLGVLVIWGLHYYTNLPFEALTGVVFALSLAVSFLIIPHHELGVALLGDISQVTPLAVLVGSTASMILLFLVNRVYNHLVVAALSEDIALVQGIPLKRDTLLYLACIGLVVALGVRIVGGLMTAALVTIPPATAYNLSRSLSEYTILSLLCGAVSCSAGIIAHLLLGYPVGPLIILCSGVLFFVSLLFKK